MSQETSYEEKSQLNGAKLTESEPEIQDSLPQPPAPQPKKGLSGLQGLLLGVVVGVVLTLVGNRLNSSQQVESAPQATPVVATATQAPAKSITTATVTTESVARTLEATGSVGAWEMIPVLSQANGLQIKQVLVDEGEWVQRGEVMARLDDAVLQAQLTQAKAEMAQAEARLAELRAGTRREEIAQGRENVNSAQAEVRQAESDLDLAQKRVVRNRSLEADGAIARDRLDEVLNEERVKKANLQAVQARLQEAKQRLALLQAGPRREVISQAEAQLARAKGQVELVTAQLKDTRVLAPVSGKIANRNARVGDVTSNSQRLFEIIENGRLELRLRVPETDLAQIRPGQTVQITSQINRGLKLSGKIREIDPVINESSRQAIVEVDLPSSSSLQPGMFLQAAITTATTTGLTIPSKAVLPQSDGSVLVYKLAGQDTVQAQSVEMGKLLPGGKVEILSGLSAGDAIVLKGAAYLKDGDRISISNPETLN